MPHTGGLFDTRPHIPRMIRPQTFRLRSRARRGGSASPRYNYRSSYKPWIVAFYHLFVTHDHHRLGFQSRTVLIDLNESSVLLGLCVGQQRSQLCFICVPRSHLVRIESIIGIVSPLASTIVIISNNYCLCCSDAHYKASFNFRKEYPLTLMLIQSWY